jgi:DNA-binding beta-propeller fold protein YncE
VTARKPTKRRCRVGLCSGAALTALAGLLTLSSGSAAQAGSARPAATAATTLPAYGTIWVTAQSIQSLLEFAPGANGQVTPIADISGVATGLNNPAGLAIDHHGRLWVANFSASMIAVFGAHATGNVAPVMTIAGAATELNAPVGIALAQNGDVWVANSGSSTLAEFAAGAHGNIAPIRTIGGSNTLLGNLTGIAVSPDGTRVWVSEQRGSKAKVPPALAEFAGTAHGNVKPLAQISGSKTRLNDPYGVAVGVNGNDPITDNSNTDHPQAILKFASGAHGNATPKVIKGGSTGLSEPRLLAIDAVGDIWVPNALNDLVIRFGPTQHGNVAPLRLLFGNGSMLDTPGSVAVFLAPPSVPRAVHAHGTKKSLRIKWSRPHVAGGGILGYQVRRAHKKSGPWTVVATTTKRSYRKSHPHKGFYYEIEAFNNAGYSAPTHARKPKI